MTGLDWITKEKRTRCPKCNKIQMVEWRYLFDGKAKCINCDCKLTMNDIKKNKPVNMTFERIERNRKKEEERKKLFLERIEIMNKYKKNKSQKEGGEK